MELTLREIGSARLLIIEGIPGSGKDTMQTALTHYYEDNGYNVYNFTEEELLFSWKHKWINHIEFHRIKLMHSVLDYCEWLLGDPRNIVILNRFHISYAVISPNNKEAKPLYRKLIERLEKLPIHILIGKLANEKIKEKSLHSEREDPRWLEFQDRKMKYLGFESIADMHKAEQDLIFYIAEWQALPYSTFYTD